jgi:hypothetical protein
MITVVFWYVAMLFQWWILLAMINPQSCLPYSILVVSIIFLVFLKYKSFLNLGLMTDEKLKVIISKWMDSCFENYLDSVSEEL